MLKQRRFGVGVALGVLGLVGVWLWLGTGRALRPQPLLRVLQDGKWGVIDREGGRVLPCAYEAIRLYGAAGLLQDEPDAGGRQAARSDWSRDVARLSAWGEKQGDEAFLSAAPVYWVAVETQTREWRFTRRLPYLTRAERTVTRVYDAQGRLRLSCDRLYGGRGADLLYARAGRVLWLHAGRSRNLGAAPESATLLADGRALLGQAVYDADGVKRYEAVWATPEALAQPICGVTMSDATVMFVDTVTGETLGRAPGREAVWIYADVFVVLRPGERQLLCTADGRWQREVLIERALVQDNLRRLRTYFDADYLRDSNLIRRGRHYGAFFTTDALVLVDRWEPEPRVIQLPGGSTNQLTARTFATRTVWEAPAAATAGPGALLLLQDDAVFTLVASTGQVLTLSPRVLEVTVLDRDLLLTIRVDGAPQWLRRDGQPATRPDLPVRLLWGQAPALLANLAESADGGYGLWSVRDGWVLPPVYTQASAMGLAYLALADATGQVLVVDRQGRTLLEPLPAEQMPPQILPFPELAGGVYLAMPRLGTPDAKPGRLLLCARDHRRLGDLPDGGQYRAVGRHLLAHYLSIPGWDSDLAEDRPAAAGIAAGAAGDEAAAYIAFIDPLDLAADPVPGRYVDWELQDGRWLWVLDADGRGGWLDLETRRWLWPPSD